MSSKPGQGRRFDLEEALDAALRMFWQHGYDGVGVAGLARAMGISVSSLYAAFGSKQELFEATLGYYQRRYGTFAERAFETSSRMVDFSRTILGSAAESFTAEDLPKGCYVISGSTSLSPEAAQLAARISRVRNENVRAITTHLRERFGGELASAGVDAEAISRLLSAVLQGMSQQSIDGASRDELYRVARVATRSIGALFEDVPLGD
jgi:AcrR family transcriptional regulator